MCWSNSKPASPAAASDVGAGATSASGTMTCGSEVWQRMRQAHVHVVGKSNYIQEGTRRNSARHLDQGARGGEPAAEAAAEAAEAAT